MTTQTHGYYEVNLYGSHPNSDNDDCWCSDTFDTYEEALKVFTKPETHFEDWALDGTRYVELKGHDDKSVVYYDVKEVFGYINLIPDDDEDWYKELAHEEGMLNGLDSFNDWMGY